MPCVPYVVRVVSNKRRRTVISGILRKRSGRNLGKQELATDLNFSPCTVNPFGVIGHTIDVGKRLEPHFDFTGIVENTTASIHMVNDWGQAVVRCGIAENCVIPALEVRVICD